VAIIVAGSAPASAVFDENNPASISVTLTVPDTSLTINGRGSPHAFVTIKDNGGTAGTGVSGANGSFNILLGSRSAGAHSIEISATDNDGNTTDTVSYTINLTIQSNTTLNLFLPPTISTKSANSGGSKVFLLYGYTIPNAQVTVVIDSSKVFVTTSNQAGRWQLNLTSLGISSGAHQVVAQAEDSLHNSSYITQPTQITVTQETPDDAGQSPESQIENQPLTRNSTAAIPDCNNIDCTSDTQKLPAFERTAGPISHFSADTAKGVALTTAAVAGFYALFLGGLLLVGKGMEAGEMAAIIPNGASLLKSLMNDPRLGISPKVVVAIAAGYLISPLDLVPDLLPVVGYMDDAIIIVLALRFVVRHAGLEIISEHWHGSEKSLEIIKKLAGIKKL
jgi:uncharacterized membrane protein YkvA (DUF1232 family)